MKKTRILLTGSTGYVGRHLLPELIKSGYWLNILVRKPDRNVNKQTLNVYCGDLDNPKILNLALKKVDIVVHLAAHLSVYEDGLVKKTNIDGLKNLLSQIKKNNSVKKIIFISTVDVCLRANDYSQSKKVGEKLVENFSIQNNINYVIVRLGNIFDGDRGGMKKGLVELIEKKNWKSAILFHQLGKRTLRLVDISEVISKLTRIISSRKRNNYVTEIAGKRQEIKTIIESLKLKNDLDQFPQTNIFFVVLFFLWKRLGRLANRADLLIYLDTEII